MHVFLTSAALILTVSICAAQSVDISCEVPPVIQFASVSEVTDEEYAVGSTVTYACQFGYASKGESRILQCVLSDDEKEAEWTEPKFSCNPQSCGDPGYILNGRRVGTLFTFPNSVKYECDDGYKLVGLSVRYCQTSGSWSGRLPTCVVVTCNSPGNLDNGHVTYNSLEYGAELKYICDKGFRLNTDETIFCNSEGSWSNIDVKCIESACEIPLAPEFGSVQLGGNGDKPRAGSIVIFSCHGDRIPDGPVNSKCMEDGQWTFPTPKCLEPCSIPYINEGAIGRHYRRSGFRKEHIGKRVKDDEQFFIQCFKGYEIAGTAERERVVSCKNGKWSAELECIPASCRSLPPPAENTKILNKIPGHGGKVYYSCITDYRKIENETVFCEFGEWKGNPPVCKNTRCSVDKLEFPGLLKGTKYFYRDNEIFKIECDARYQVATSGLLRCEDGNWEGPLPPCTAASCKEPPPPVNLARAEVSSMKHGSPVKYVCEPPYILVGYSEVQCLFGKWTGRFPRCEDGRCYLKNLGKSSHVSADTPYVTSSGSQLNVICKIGYSPRLESPICLNGKWTRNSVSPCKENDCSVPFLYYGEVIEEKRGDYYLRWFKYVQEITYEKVPGGRVVTPGTIFIVSCYNGYSFQGTSINRREITCTEGRWLPHPVCQRVGTKYIPPPPPAVSRQRVATYTSLATSYRSTSTTAKITTMSMTSTITTVPTVEQDLTVDEETTDLATEAEPKVEECICVYSVNDENLVASAGGKRLNFRDSVPDGSTVLFRCKHVGFHLFNGQHEIRCENCGRWNTTAFPTCTDPTRGNAVILYDNNLNITDEGNLEVRRGRRVKLRCIAIESAIYPHWNTPISDGINITNERKERKTYGDILYISHLEIEHADFENGGPYECAVGNNTVTVVQLAVIDPNVLCPAFQEEDGISLSYEMERRVKSKAVFSCSNKGQELSGKGILTCLGNGQWSDPPPRCQDIKCKELKGNDMLQIHYTKEREVGSLATFHCFSPGKRSGVSFTKCLENGSWSDPTPTCTHPPCSVQDLFSGLAPNVVPDMTDVSNKTLPYGTSVRMTCEEDFIVIGDPIAKCEKNATWEVPSIHCISGCSALEKPSESKLIIKPEKDIYKFGEMITFSCPPGMGLNTESQLIMCLKNGWSESILPECEEGRDYEYEEQTTDQSVVS